MWICLLGSQGASRLAAEGLKAATVTEIVGHCRSGSGPLRDSDIALPEVVVVEDQLTALPARTNVWMVLEEAQVELSCRTGGTVAGPGAARNRTFSYQRRRFGSLMCVVVDGNYPVRSLDIDFWDLSFDLRAPPTDLESHHSL